MTPKIKCIAVLTEVRYKAICIYGLVAARLTTFDRLAGQTKCSA